MTVRVLITGSREFADRPAIAAALSAVARQYPGQTLTVVHGGARGADSLAGAIARDFPEQLIEERHIVSDWGSKSAGTFDVSAGHRRNQRMVDAGAFVCLAFPSRKHRSSGTWSCVAKAKKAGIEVRVIFGQETEGV
jgi:hypothetical protein